MNVLEQLEALKVIPVVAIQDAAKAGALADALLAGGLGCAEVTFRTKAAGEAIRIMAQKEGMLVGAGTVLTREQVDLAISAGAKFIVSPGLNPDVVKHCQEIGIPITPGVATPTEIEQALSLGLKVMKFFPAGVLGGLKAIKAITAPYGMIRLIPTGGVSASNLAEYLENPKVLACGGSWMVKGELIDNDDFETITALTKEAVEVANAARP